MRANLHLALGALVLAACLGMPAHASALTLDQVIGLARAGVTDAIILALIDRDRTIFAIEPEQIVTLQRDGISEPVILAMLKSGREEGDAAARADAADTAAFIRSTLAPGPELVIVGHGPERPNTTHGDGFYSAPGMGTFYGLPYAYEAYGAYGAYGAGRRRGRGPAPVVVPPAPVVAPMPTYNSPFREPVIPPVSRGRQDAPALCYAQVATRGYVTECPAVMQPGRR